MKPFNPCHSRIILATLCACLTNLCTTTAWALPSDREQPIRIQSDTAERDEKQGLTTYRGQVHMAQGSLRIEADSVTIHSTNNKVTKIVALGNPARYQQLPEQGKQVVKATGKTIKYFVDSEKLQLIEQASVDQGGSILKGEQIDYDIQSSLMKAGQTGKPTRVEMVIQPSTLNKSSDSNAKE